MVARHFGDIDLKENDSTDAHLDAIETVLAMEGHVHLKLRLIHLILTRYFANAAPTETEEPAD